jgi:DnaJ-class molecular chaperone
MSDDTDDTAAPPDVPCSACRGTGSVISTLGGTPHQVPCPWCEGGGRRLPGHDAQAAGGAEAGGAGVGEGDGGDDDGGPDLDA